MAEPNVMLVSDAAKRLGVSPGRIRHLLDAGELGYVTNLSGRRLVTESSLKRLLAEREVKRVKRAK